MLYGEAAIIVDPFTPSTGPAYNFSNPFHGAGALASTLDFGSVSAGVWSPAPGGQNTDYFVVDNPEIQLAKVGDSVSLSFRFTAASGSAIGMVVSRFPEPNGTQAEIMIQRSGTNSYGWTNQTPITATQTDYSTLTITKTAYNSSINVSTFTAVVSGGGLSLSRTFTVFGINGYVGLAIYNNNSTFGATAKNFLFNPSPVDPFTSVGIVSYNFANPFNPSGPAGTIADFGTASGGVWNPSGTGRNTDYFVISNSAVQLPNVGDSVMLDFRFQGSIMSGAIGLVISNTLTPSTSQLEILIQRYGTNSYAWTGQLPITATQTDYSTLKVTKTGFDSTTNTSTYSAVVTGGGLSLSKTFTLVGANNYVGLCTYSGGFGVGASGRNFVIRNVFANQLNNLVAEHVNSTLTAVDKFWFTPARAGWLYVRLNATPTGSGVATVSLDGSTTQVLNVTTTNAALPEAMWYIPAGTHNVKVSSSGTVALNRLFVRSIPEIAFFTGGGDTSPNAVVRNYPTLKSTGILANYNLFQGWPTAAQIANIADWRAAGKKWMSLTGLPPFVENPSVITSTWVVPMQNSNIDGIYVDELIGTRADQAAMYPFWSSSIETMSSNTSITGKQFYMFANIGSTSAYQTIFQSIVDSGYRIAPEAYARTTGDLDWCVSTMGAWRSLVPNVQFSTSWTPMVANTANEMSSVVDPGQNYKTWLETQFQPVANHANFSGLYGLGMFTAVFADEDVLRWYTKLMRHYGIEGNTYRLGVDPATLNHISNPGFESGLTSWTVTPAITGSIQTKAASTLPFTRPYYVALPEGANVLWTQRNASAPNKISQTISNLTVGRTYHVNVYALDLVSYGSTAVLAGSVVVTGATTIASETAHTATLSPALAQPGGSPISVCWNKYHLVFTATGATATITISDWNTPTSAGGPVGQQIIWDYIDVAPDYSTLPVNP